MKSWTAADEALEKAGKILLKAWGATFD